jgi:DNA topoisomerase 2-associated protein PAT1
MVVIEFFSSARGLQLQATESNQANPFTGEHLNLLLHKQLSLPNSPMSSLLFSQYQQRLAQVQSSHQNYSNIPPHLLYPHHSIELTGRFDSVGSSHSSRDKRSRSRRGKHNIRFSQSTSDTGILKVDFNMVSCFSQLRH